ncbi:MAG: mechanosensitive ion channel [Rhodospirillaceae bacterium]|jgi:small conductance mechanosensitive channel|nr:mechanosensitive ion channel [Rhodospirillaceae bacterium]MBT3930189.1 mechanosensitive ion channel [Rhodospirillaceae bacterium]MBT4773758.1 mechanosensitive ion channel [Rhodospirillaceae bacterium]MBT5357586.1 mechanosensitive ion channel [Rhodospirillaceae bacterium]MBT5770575.1 mechanosensitive ion channel [Rhodospirillaceae bacterium]
MNNEDIQNLLEQVYAVLVSYGLNVLGALAIIIIGFMAAGWARRSLERALSRSGRIDTTLVRFFGSLLRYAIIAFVIIAALQQFGVQATSLVAVFGAAGLAIGLALQGTLSNVAAGVMLLMFRPFKIGDFISAGGQTGTVKEIGLFTTEMATGDNVKIIVPNGQIWGSAIQNFSGHTTRRVDLMMGIDYGDNIDTAMATINRVIGEEARALKDPESVVAVAELADSSVNIVVRVWVNAADYWGVRWDITKKLKEQLEADGISIPYPQQVVHHVNAAE